MGLSERQHGIVIRLRGSRKMPHEVGPRLLIVILVVVANDWQSPKCPSVVDWLTNDGTSI